MPAEQREQRETGFADCLIREARAIAILRQCNLDMTRLELCDKIAQALMELRLPRPMLAVVQQQEQQHEPHEQYVEVIEQQEAR